MDIFRYFNQDYVGHSKSAAYLLAITSHYVYNDKPPGSVGEVFEERFRRLFVKLSETDPFAVATYTDSPPDAFPYDTEVAVLSNSKLIIVVFRGTEGAQGVRDWLTNLQHGMHKAPSSWGDLRVHKGFYNALSTVYQSVRNRVRETRTANQKVFLTGHSLGGALATLCAFRLHQVGGVTVNGVYTFGAPRVGDLNFANKYNDILKSKTFRWVYKNDFGPQLPIRAGTGPFAPQYVHSGLLNMVKANGSIEMDHVDLPAGFDSSSIADHDMRRYIFTMQSRLSSDVRQSAGNPAYLVKGDIGANGFPTL